MSVQASAAIRRRCFLCLLFKAMTATITVTLPATTSSTEQTLTYQVSINNEIRINTADDWTTFCKQVESGNSSIKATLMKDLTGLTTMAGTAAHPYAGTFDGQGHQLSFNVSGTDYVAPFAYVNNASISNLLIDGTLTASGTHAAGIIGKAQGTTTLTDCAFFGTIKASVPCGLVADNQGSLTINSGYAGGKYGSATNGSTIAGGSAATLNNCYYLNKLATAQGTAVSADDVKNGNLASMLQGARKDNVWGQNLAANGDAHPVLTSDNAKRVYRADFVWNGNTRASRFANTGKTVTLPTIQDLFGNLDGYFDFSTGSFTSNTPLNEDKTVECTVKQTKPYVVNSTDTWNTFANAVAGGLNSIKVELGADVSNVTTQVGSLAQPFTGTFDGKGKGLTLAIDGSTNYTAPFAYAQGATFNNVNVHGTVKVADKAQYASTLVGFMKGGTISNVISDAALSFSADGEKLAGGLVGYADTTAITINDSWFKGSVSKATNVAGFIGSGNSCNITLNHCLSTATYTNAKSINALYGAEGNITAKNSYALVKDGDANNINLAQGVVTNADMLSGEVAYNLQENRQEQVWGQTVDGKTELQHASSAAKVYKVSFTLGGTEMAVRYANSHVLSLPSSSEAGIGDIDLTYTLNNQPFTTSTNISQDTEVTLTRSAVKYDDQHRLVISDKKTWDTFTSIVNYDHTPVDAVLTADIEGITTMDGANGYGYKGVFDGQGHKLTVKYDSVYSNAAPFRFVAGRKDTVTVIKNLRTSGTISNFGSYTGGIIAEVQDSFSVELLNCVSDATLKGPQIFNLNMGGLVGASNGKLLVNACAYLGQMKALNAGYVLGYPVAGIVGTGWVDLRNSYALATAEANQGGDAGALVYDRNSNVVNSYFRNVFSAWGNQIGHKLNDAQLKSGELANLLQGDSKTTIWGQTIGTDSLPMPSADSKKQVCRVEFQRDGRTKFVKYANLGKTVTPPTAADFVGESLATAFSITYANDFSEATTVDSNLVVACTLKQEGVYQIKDEESWKAFADAVTSGKQTTVNAELMNDITLTKPMMVGATVTNGYIYQGTFEGHGHTITLNWDITKDNIPQGSESSYNQMSALFYGAKNSTFRNFNIKGHHTTALSYEVSALLGSAEGDSVNISNVNTDVQLFSTKQATYGLQLSGMVSSIHSGCTVNFKNCLVTKNVPDTTLYMAYYGYIYNNSGTSNIDHCVFNAKADEQGGMSNDHAFVSSYAGTNHVTNSFCTLDPSSDNYGTKVSSKELKDGYVTYMLQNGLTEQTWGQTLGVDPMPVLTPDMDKKLCRVNFVYGDTVLFQRFANVGKKVTDIEMVSSEMKALVTKIDSAKYNESHYYDLVPSNFTADMPVYNDMTVGCELVDKDAYDIASEADWNRFATLVTHGLKKMNARLTKDVTLHTGFTTVGNFYSEGWNSYANYYGGHFNGQGHKLTLAYSVNKEADATAPFNMIAGAKISNLLIDGTITSAHYGVSALVNAVETDSLTLERIVSNVNIKQVENTTNTSQNDQGVASSALVRNLPNNTSVVFNDCLVKGSFTAADDNTVYNPMIGNIDAGSEYAKAAEVKINNCLYKGKEAINTTGFGTVTNSFFITTSDERLSSGELAYKLQAGRDSLVWGEKIGADDMPSLTTKKELRVYVSNYGDNTQVYDNRIIIDENKDNVFTAMAGVPVKLNRAFTADTWATLVLPFNMTTEEVEDAFGSDVEVAYFDNDNYNIISLNTSSTKDIPANTPVLIRTKENKKDVVFDNRDIVQAKPVTVGNNFLNMVGTYKTATIAKGDLYLGDNKLWVSDGSATAKATRAYFLDIYKSTTDDSGQIFAKLMINGEIFDNNSTTGIEEVIQPAKEESLEDKPVYSLSGQKVAESLSELKSHSVPAGIYIVGGKKILIK